MACTLRTLGWLLPCLALAAGCGEPALERRLAAAADGELSVDIELGGGLSFDKGSLEIVSHEEGDVRVVADTSGWGGYAVDLDITERDGNVRVVGRVEGALHWMFGGPTVDVRIEVPSEYGVRARIDGGPLLLEDLGGSVKAQVTDSDLAVHRADGPVRLTSREGAVRVEDVNGALRIESSSGPIAVSGVRGAVEIRAKQGKISVESTTGRVNLATDRGEIALERVKGDVRVVSEHGSIAVEDVVGRLQVETQRGRVAVEELEGPIHAITGRGGIDVEFSGVPEGRIETERGSIQVEVPARTAFSLAARTDRGELALDDELAFVLSTDPDDVPADWKPVEHPLERRSREIAAEVQANVAEALERVRRDLEEQGIDTDFGGFDGFGDWGDWNDWNDARSSNADSEDGAKRRRPWQHWGPGGRHATTLTGDINGGGPDLLLRTERGSIHVEER